jgi:uncharacterized protein YjdB
MITHTTAQQASPQNAAAPERHTACGGGVVTPQPRSTTVMKLNQSLFAASLVLGLTAGLGCSGTTPTGGTSTGGTSTGGSATEDGKVISSVEITPDKATLSRGASQQFHATVHFADGTTEDITESKDAVWNTSEPTVATVTKRGMVSAAKAGIVDITVEYKGEKANEHFIVTP